MEITRNWSHTNCSLKHGLYDSDYRPIAAIATTATGIACLLIFVQEMLDIGHYPDVKFPSTDFGNFFEAFGVILFAFGGHAIFPSVQHDMKDTRKFHWTVGISYVGMHGDGGGEGGGGVVLICERPLL